MKRLSFLFAVVFLMSVPQLSHGQWTAAPHVVISVPSSDFANVSGTGGGFGIKVVRNFGGRDGFGLRGDFSFLSHGREFTTVRISGFPYLSEVRHQSLRLTFGPQVSFGSRNLRFQGGLTGGFYIFRTTLDISTDFGFFQDQSGDAAVGWNMGGGFQYDIGLGPWLDFSFEYNTIYNITTERAEETSPGMVEISSVDITANEFIIKFGIIFFLK